MSEVSQNVIMDLLPLYLAGEVSEDTAALVKGYVQSHPEVAQIINQMNKAESLSQVPAPFSREVAIKTFQQAKKWTVIQTLGLALIIGLFLLAAMALTFTFFFSW